jgi:hypothetical protein
MRRRKGRLAKLLSLPVLAVCGFAVAATMAGVGLATEMSSTTTTTVPEPTTTPTTTTTTTTPTTTTPRGNEGCTPGFWKNHPEAWVGFDPDETLGSVFSEAPDSIADVTLLDALSLRGGDVNALARQAVAALLNAANPDVDYPLTEAEIISMVNDAFATGEGVESLKDTLDEFNNLAAPGFCD